MHLVARGLQFLVAHQRLDQAAKNFRANSQPLAQLLLVDAGDQGILLVKLFDCCERSLAQLGKSFGGDQQAIAQHNFACLLQRIGNFLYSRGKPSGFGDRVGE